MHFSLYHLGDRCPQSWLILSSRIQRVLVGQCNRPILLADKIGQLYRSSDIPFTYLELIRVRPDLLLRLL